MKVEILKPFRDKQTWDRHRAGDTPDIKADRARHFESLGLARIISETDLPEDDDQEEDDAGDL